MTKSTITRERIQRIIRAIDSEAYDEEEIREWLSSDEIMELSRIALAAMDSDPVAEVVSIYGDPEAFGEREIRPLVGIQQMPYGTKLYRHAQQQVVSADLLHTAASAIEDLLTTKDRTGAGVWFDLPFRLRSAANAQPVPVVSENVRQIENAAAALEHIGNFSDAAIIRQLVSGKRAPVCTCPSGDGSLRWPCPVHAGNSPTQSYCCPAQNSVNPAQGGNSLVIPDEMTSGQAYEIGYYYGDPVDVFARGANWMRQHIIDSTLAAAPQEVK